MKFWPWHVIFVEVGCVWVGRGCKSGHSLFYSKLLIVQFCFFFVHQKSRPKPLPKVCTHRQISNGHHMLSSALSSKLSAYPVRVCIFRQTLRLRGMTVFPSLYVCSLFPSHHVTSTICCGGWIDLCLSTKSRNFVVLISFVLHYIVLCSQVPAWIIHVDEILQFWSLLQNIACVDIGLSTPSCCRSSSFSWLLDSIQCPL